MLVADGDVLEQPLAISRLELVRLACHFGAIQSENWPGVRGQPPVVVYGLVCVIDADPARSTEWILAVAADASAVVKVNSRAGAAQVIGLARPNDAKLLIDENAPVVGTRAGKDVQHLALEIGWRPASRVRDRLNEGPGVSRQGIVVFSGAVSRNSPDAAKHSDAAVCGLLDDRIGYRVPHPIECDDSKLQRFEIATTS